MMIANFKKKEKRVTKTQLQSEGSGMRLYKVDSILLVMIAFKSLVMLHGYYLRFALSLSFICKDKTWGCIESEEQQTDCFCTEMAVTHL